MKLEFEGNKEKFDFVFVVLCYRNTNDLQVFINSASNLLYKYRIIVVNNYYDDKTKNTFYNIARQSGCDFINIPNKGYGSGNNCGIEYALQNYEFDYLVICNPDIEFISFSKNIMDGMVDCIIAPDIKTLSGKAQNPFIYRRNKFIEWLEYHGFKIKFKPLLYLGFAINKIFREISNVFYRVIKIKKRRIYAAHGACVVFGSNAIRKLGIPYDENMFLFCEEFHLAKLAEKNNIPTFYVPELNILHREDGSVSFINNNAFEIQADSFIYYYEKWYMNRKVECKS